MTEHSEQAKAAARREYGIASDEPNGATGVDVSNSFRDYCIVFDAGRRAGLLEAADTAHGTLTEEDFPTEADLQADALEAKDAEFVRMENAWRNEVEKVRLSWESRVPPTRDEIALDEIRPVMEDDHFRGRVMLRHIGAPDMARVKEIREILSRLSGPVLPDERTKG